MDVRQAQLSTKRKEIRGPKDGSAHALARQKRCHNAVLESEREHAKSDTNIRIGIFSHGDIRHAIDPHRGVHLFINVFFFLHLTRYLLGRFAFSSSPVYFPYFLFFSFNDLAPILESLSFLTVA